jgi:hypothetical protein
MRRAPPASAGAAPFARDLMQRRLRGLTIVACELSCIESEIVVCRALYVVMKSSQRHTGVAVPPATTARND